MRWIQKQPVCFGWNKGEIDVKKDTLAIIGSVVLGVILIALFVLEIQNPQGGVAMLSGIIG